MFWLAAAAAVKIYGQYEANKAQAKAERANAKYYGEQAKLAKQAALRTKAIFDRESDAFVGTQVNMFAKAGVDLSGSALLIISQTKANQQAESNAILIDGNATERLARMRMQSSYATAKTLNSQGYNLLQAGGTVLDAYAMSKGYEERRVYNSTDSTSVSGTSSGGNPHTGHFNVDPMLTGMGD